VKTRPIPLFEMSGERKFIRKHVCVCVGGDTGKLVSQRSGARHTRISTLMEQARRMALAGDGEEIILQELDKVMASRWYLSASSRRDYLQVLEARMMFESQASKPATRVQAEVREQESYQSLTSFRLRYLLTLRTVVIAAIEALTMTLSNLRAMFTIAIAPRVSTAISTEVIKVDRYCP
jgi:hypothetical protein